MRWRWRTRGSGPATTRWDCAAVERNVVADLGLLGLTLCALFLPGCRQDMHDQAKYKPYRHSPFFSDGRTSRPLPPDTVARGQLHEDGALHTGKLGGELVRELPAPVTAATLQRGQERYNIYCSPCHDQSGSGNGMIVQRGYRRPPSLHEERLRQQPVGHFYDVIRNGVGVMPNYAQQISVDDRWAIVAYIRALQLSQNARVEDVPMAERARLDSPPASAQAAHGAHHE